MKNFFLFILLLISGSIFGQTTIKRDTTRIPIGTDSTLLVIRIDTTVIQTGTTVYTYPKTSGKTFYVTIKNTNNPNQLPICNAGSAQSITLPVNSINLAGSASDLDGTISSIVWTKQSGGNAVIVSPTSLSTSVNGLVQGTYIFNLKVTDNDAGSCSSNVTVTVNAQAVIDTSSIKILGFGENAIGGEGKPIYTVTTIAASGLGSLAAGIGSNKKIVFSVAGTINSGFSLNNISYLTIDGSSAPYPGITITNSSGDGLSLAGSSNHIIIKGLTFANCSGDGFNAIEQANNFAFTNCTTYGNGDGNGDAATDAYLGTIQYCIFGWNKGFSQGNSGGCLITGRNISYHHNLTNTGINNAGQDGERNPFVHRNYGTAGTPDADIRNNLIWNFGRDNATGTGFGSGSGYNAKINVVNNYYYTKSSAAAGDAVKLNVDNTTSSGYVAGNISGNGINVNSKSNSSEFSIPAQYQIPNETACASASIVLQKAGIIQRSNGLRNPTEQLLINGITITAGCSGTSTACIGYLYSNWTVCNNGTRTRTVTGFTPNGCNGNPSFQPVLSESCSVDTGGNNPGYTLVYSTGYDDVNSIDPFGHTQWGTGTQSDHLSTTVFKTSPGSFLSIPANVSSGIRSEVQYGSGQTPLEGIVEYDVYYDNFFANSGHSLQWHPTTSGGSGTGLYHKNGQLQFVTVKSATSGTDVGSPFSVSTKAWHHMKLTYKFGSSGYIKVEFDGVEKVNSNVQMGDGSAPYLKVGVNMWADQTSVVYYDNLKVYKKG